MSAAYSWYPQHPRPSRLARWPPAYWPCCPRRQCRRHPRDERVWHPCRAGSRCRHRPPRPVCAAGTVQRWTCAVYQSLCQSTITKSLIICIQTKIIRTCMIIKAIYNIKIIGIWGRAMSQRLLYLRLRFFSRYFTIRAFLYEQISFECRLIFTSPVQSNDKMLCYISKRRN